MTLRYKTPLRSTVSGKRDGSQPPLEARVLPGTFSRNPHEPLLSPSDGGSDHGDQFSKMLQWKWLILLCVVLGAAIGAWRASSRPIFYVGIATVTLPDEREKYFYSPATIADPTQKYFRAYFFERKNTISEVLNSLAARQDVANYMAGLSEPTSRKDSDINSVSAGSRELALRSMAVPTASVQVDSKSSMMTITTTSLQSEAALKSVEGYLRVLKYYYEQKKRGDAQKAVVWLEEKLARAKKDLDASQAALQSFRKNHGVYTQDVETAINSKLASGWLERLGQSDEDSADESFSASSFLTMGGPKSAMPGESRIANLQKKVSALQSKYADMQQTYAPTYPTMVVTKKQINLLQSMIADLEQQQRVSAAALNQETALMEKKEQEQAWNEAVQLNAAGPEFRLLKMDVETNEKFYDVLAAEYKKAKSRATAEAEDFVVSGLPSVFAIRPKYKRKVAIGALLGLCGGVVIALALVSMDTKLRSGSEVELHFRCKALGSVPDFSSYRKSEISTVPGKSGGLEFLAHDDPESPIYEPIRNIQSSIFLSSMGSRIRCLAVTSSLPGEGKTLIAVSLASVMCLDKSKSVLIIDGDLRRPRIHRIFGHPHPGRGLTTLVRKGSVDWSGMVHSSRLPGLYYLMSGPIPRDPVATLRSETFEEVLASLRDSFDHIIIDSPPLLGFPDAVIASTMADGTVIVVEEGAIRREIMAETLGALTSVPGTRVVGVVFNKAKQRQLPWYASYMGYGYRYGRYGKYGKYA